ncbi:hypothetical protein ACHQM5_011151 [Ranunculus cassubicifolius]
MGEILTVLLAICGVFLVSTAWKALNWVWFKPKKMEMYFKQQGLRGPPYKFLYGNVKELLSSTNEAKAKPMEFSHQILPCLMPFFLQLIKKYGKFSSLVHIVFIIQCFSLVIFSS